MEAKAKYTTSAYELSVEDIQKAVTCIISKMPQKTSQLHRDTLTAFANGNYKEVKRLAVLNPLDNYIKALSFLGGAFNPANIASGNSYTILHEATMKAAELVKEQTALEVAAELDEIFRLAQIFN